MLLLLFGDRLVGKSDRQKTEATSLEAASAYREELELTASSLCASVNGVESARVCLTMAGGIRFLYAKNGESGGYAICGGDALFLGYEYPSVTGCAVVYTGKNADTVVWELTQLLSSFLNIPASKICVSGRS